MDIQQKNKAMLCQAFGHIWQVETSLYRVCYTCERCGAQMFDVLRAHNAENLVVTNKGNLEVRRLSNSGRIEKNYYERR